MMTWFRLLQNKNISTSLETNVKTETGDQEAFEYLTSTYVHMKYRDLQFALNSHE